MKGILEFNLPEDQTDFKLAQDGIKFYCILSNIKLKIRNLQKYEFEDTKEFYIKMVEEIKQELLDFNGDDYG
jgi:hypothetical protein